MNELKELVYRLGGCDAIKEKDYFITEARMENGMWILRVCREEKGVCELSEITQKVERYDKKFEIITAVKCSDDSWALTVTKPLLKEKDEKKDSEEE